MLKLVLQWGLGAAWDFVDGHVVERLFHSEGLGGGVGGKMGRQPWIYYIVSATTYG